MPGDATEVGSIIGFLKMDTSDFERGVATAIAGEDALKSSSGGLQDSLGGVDTASRDAATSTRQLGDEHERTRVRTDEHRQSTDDLGRSQDRTTSRTGALVTAILGLGPALIPIGAAALGLGAAFGGMGAAGLAAVIGIKNEMEAGTAVGQAYRAGLDSLATSFNGLASIAATNFLGSFQQGVAILNGSMPQLNGLIGEMSAVAGRAGVNLVSGLVAGFLQLGPLMQDASVYVLDLTSRFNGLMSGTGVTTFADYVRSVFPQVMSTVESLVGAAIRLVAAFAPLGGGILSAVQALADVINAIPVDVLAVIATTATSVFLGFRAWSALSGIIQPVAGALQAVGVSAEATGAAIRGMTLAAGAIGIVVTALTIAFTAQAEKARENEQAINDYADALARSNGVINASIQATAAKKLQDQGVLDTARELGYSLDDVSKAAIGNSDAIQRVNDHSAALQQTQSLVIDSGNRSVASLLGQRDAFGNLQQVTVQHTGALVDQQAKIDQVTGAIGTNNTQLDAAGQKYRDLQAATNAQKASLDGVSTATMAAAGALGVAVPTMQAAVDASDKHAAAASAATLQMQLEGDAAGLLKQALDTLNGVTLTVEQSVTREAGARQAATKTLTDNKASMDLNSAAGVANRGALEQAALGAQAHAEAVAKQTGSTQAGTAALGASKVALENELRATGNLTPAVQAYIDKLYAVPPVVQTKIEADTAIAQARVAAFAATLNSLHDRTITVTTQNQTIDSGAYAGKQVGVGQAFGGLWRGGVQAMAAGGYPERQSMISSTPILWGEAGTEAYINLTKPGPRSNSILAEANQALGNPLGVGQSDGVIQAGGSTGGDIHLHYHGTVIQERDAGRWFIDQLHRSALRGDFIPAGT